MKLFIIFSFLHLSVLCRSYVEANGVKFGPLCSEHSSNRKRACDTNYGCGYFGASRGARTHEGLDIVCNDGATVLAPFDVTVISKAAPYINQPEKEPINDGITLKGEGLCFKLFYVKPVSKPGTTLKKGQRIGTLLPMQTVYPGITSHIHVQMCDKSDPTTYF